MLTHYTEDQLFEQPAVASSVGRGQFFMGMNHQYRSAIENTFENGESQG